MSNLEAIADLGAIAIWDGVRARVVAGERLSLAVVELDGGALVPEHDHANEQLGLVITGSVDFTVGAERRTLGPGGTWRIPGGTPHTVRAGEAGAVVIDVFAPPREDWEGLPPADTRAPRWPAP